MNAKILARNKFSQNIPHSLILLKNLWHLLIVLVLPILMVTIVGLH